ncbi:proheparin-binding EGF-like growth factor isoform X2 [Coregonus clupeaformis]|uniref:proheparin-binding EGF-like growth factor isoform X2 n=1 Tax=Coregonus clupeaformis TaxID=59861 RepID=UPI001BDFA29E|nr:proheparin-binding EGF-like growth factor isoform X2 [Coregonus clupeaformis]
MNTLILSSLLCLVFSALGVLGSAVTLSAGLSHVTGALASGEGERLQSSLGEEDEEELELDEDLSGGSPTDGSPQVLRPSKDQKRKRKSQKGKRKNRNDSNNSTTAFNPEHTSGHTPEFTTEHPHQTSGRVTEDPCSSSHQAYCIHGNCKYMADLREPVCVCERGYDGERCGILLLPTRNDEEEESSRAEVVQTVLVIIAVVLSSISCLAILLLTCAHYRTHKNFLAAYLGSGSEKEQLQKTTPCDITV